MKTVNHKYSIFAALLLTFCTGCASRPPTVLTLADKTAANVGVLSSHMGQLASVSKSIAERRAANIAQLHAANTEVRARYLYDIELTKKAGQTSDLTLMKEIEAWGATVREFRVDRAEVAATFQKELLTTQTKIDTQSAALSEIAVALAGLAQEDSKADRLAFMVGYTSEVKVEMDKRLAEDNDTARRAQALLDHLSE